MNFPDNLLYSKDHEWINVEGDVARIGITNYAQEQLGDVVFVELPEAGRQFQQGNDAAVVESVKAASEVYAPVSGEIVEPNTKLEDDPALVNQDPTESGWFFTMKVSNPDELNDLMDEAAYADYVKELG